MTIDFNKVGAEAASTEDLTVERAAERVLARAGIALCRYIGYFETGKHLPANPSYNAAYKCIHVFELNHPDHMIELEGGNKVPQRIFVHQNKGTTAKSGYMKMFKVMNLVCDNKYNHFIQMLGTGFLAEVYHNTSKDGKKTYANLHLDGAWSFKKPVMVDVMTNVVTPIPVPEAVEELKGFLWENDGIQDDDVVTMWESLFIEGEKDNGDSKNWIQNTIQENIEWEGSRTQSLTQEFIGLEEPNTTVADETKASMAAMAAIAQPDPVEEEVPF